METKRPAAVTFAAIILLVLSLFVAGLGIASQYGLFGRGSANRQFLSGQFRNRNFTPPNGLPFNGSPGAQNDQGITPNFAPNQQLGMGISRIFRLIRPLTIGLDVVLLVLSVVASIALFKRKRWGAVLAILLAVLIALLSIPGLLRSFLPVLMVEDIIRILLSVAVIVLLLLPVARRSYLPAPETADLNEI